MFVIASEGPTEPQYLSYDSATYIIANFLPTSSHRCRVGNLNSDWRQYGFNEA